MGLALLAPGLLSACGDEVVARAQSCSPNNPFVQDATAPTSKGSLAVEKAWVHAFMDESYLWYDEIPDVDATKSYYSNEDDVYGSLNTYFKDLRTTAVTASGAPRDRFSFTYATGAWNDLFSSGAELSYGVAWIVVSSECVCTTPECVDCKVHRIVRIAYVEPDSPAAQAGMTRGDTVVTVDGISIDAESQSEMDALNAGLSPTSAATHSIELRKVDDTTYTATLTATTVTTKPVLRYDTLAVNGQKVGYILFNSHIVPAEAQLIEAAQSFEEAGISDLVLDLRYNGGGYLYIADELAAMIAGHDRSAGKVFEYEQFNDKRDSDTAASVSYFLTTDCLPDETGNCTSSAPLPSLDLARVLVLTTESTCSASEAIINSLRGIDVQVILIGQTTCGKPYAMIGQDNCGISYFPIEMQGTNAKGFGDYADGFAPDCVTPDDFAHELGDTSEGMLAEALYYQANGSCQPATGFAPKIAGVQQGTSALSTQENEAAVLIRPAPLENAILVRPR